jgi:gluconolactonase
MRGTANSRRFHLPRHPLADAYREGRNAHSARGQLYGQALRRPNDVVVKSDGANYFTDTFGAFRLREKDPRKELDFNSVFMWKDGKLTLVEKNMPMTNGLAFSPDKKYLYVNGSRDNYVNRFEVFPDGTLANGKLFIDLSKDGTERG